MQNESSSIFNQDFAQETLLRRRQLMPLPLKIFVWLFFVLAISLSASSLYVFWGIRLALPDPVDRTAIFTALSNQLVPVLCFLSSLFIWLEKRWSVLFALIVAALFMITSCLSMIRLFAAGIDMSYGLINLAWLLLEIPYFILLVKIKPDWETKAVAGKALTNGAI